MLIDRGAEVGGGSLGLSNDGGVGVLGVLSLELSLVLGGELVSLLSGDLRDNVGLVLGSKGLSGGNGLDSVLVVVDVPLPERKTNRHMRWTGQSPIVQRWYAITDDND